jgi:hypothetical protein
MKRLKDQKIGDYNINTVVNLFNDFIDLNNPAVEKEAMCHAFDGAIRFKDASNQSYTKGIFCLLHIIAEELSDTVYIKIDRGVFTVNMIKPWHEIYLKAKSII